MNHGSLFSGIGGFDLAAHRCGWANIFQVEIDKYCQQLLNKRFPETLKFTDIKEFDGTQFRGQIDVISGGFPCQPFSVAGKRKGKEDDRYLWPEMFRVIKEIKPAWVVGENVAGFVNMGLGQSIADLESEGYEVQPFIIPACAVNAPHRRDRIWIVGHREPWDIKRMEENEIERTARTVNAERCGEDVAHRTSERLERQVQSEQSRNSRRFTTYDRREQYAWDKNWIEVATKLCGVDDGLPVELDGFKLSKSRHRVERLKGLGNAIHQQVAYEIFNAINEVS